MSAVTERPGQSVDARPPAVLRSSRWPAWLAVAALHLLAVVAIWQGLRSAVAPPAPALAMVVRIVAAPPEPHPIEDVQPGRAQAARPAPAPAAPPQAITLQRPTAPAAADAPPTTAPASGENAPLDLDAARAAAVRDAARGGRPLVRELPQRDPRRGVTPLEADTPLGENVARARRPDCRYAYAEAGLLGAIPLLIDAFRDNGCSWTAARDAKTIVD